MSYPHMSHYYRSSSNAQSSQQGYAGTRDAAPNTNAYHNQTRGTGDGRQGQYAPAGYEWPSQSQNTAGVDSQNTYANDSWQNRASNGGSQNYQRSYYTPPEPVNAAPQNYQSRDPYNSQNAHGLNNLAYVSGFESAANAGNKTRPATGQNVGAYSQSAVHSTGQNNASVQSNNYDRYPPGYSQTSTSSIPRFDQTQHRNEPSSTSNQDLALDAAAALAGAMQARYPQHNPNPDPTRAAVTSQSPTVRSAQTMGQNAIQRTASPHESFRPNENTRPKSSHTKSNAGRAGQRTPTTSQPQSQKQPVRSQGHQQLPANQPQPSSQNATSISNLVTAPDEPEQEVYGSVEQQEAMPNYIDPTQVFNPYHREYERRKLEAAEAEAQRKAEEQRLAEEKRKATEKVALEKSAEPSTAANSKSKITKKSNVVAASGEPLRTNQSSTDNPNTTSQEEAMAAEMKNIMSKMKEFKTSNPSLFQKLWNDLRAGGSSAMAATATATAVAAEPQTSPSPQATHSALRAEAGTSEKSSSKKSEKFQDPSPIPRNGFKPVIENNPEGLPDLGRFPAERRIRQSYAKPKGEQQTSTSQTSVSAPLPETDRTRQSTTPARQGEQATVWPEPRRRAVAIAAIHFLKSNPENANLKLTAQDISSILEQNPSYLDLCTALESQGFKFHKSLFARELLRSVPELQSASSKGATRANQEINTISSVAHGPSPQPPSVLPVPVSVAPQQLPTTQVSGVNQTQPLSSNAESVTPGSNQPQAVKQAEFIFYRQSGLKTENGTATRKQPSKASNPNPSVSARNEPPVGSKEAAARKRDFADLIDLTNLDDNENYVMPRKQARTDAEPTLDHSQDLSATAQPSFGQDVAPLRFDPEPPPRSYLDPDTPIAQPYKYGDLLITEAQVGGKYLPPPRQHMTTFERTKVYPILARKLDNSEALQKSYYDPRTVARDVLIASGRHTSERPLNFHLAGLLGRFFEIDSDLTTLAWDALDPDGPPVPKVGYVDIPARPPKYRLGERNGMRNRISAIDKNGTTRWLKEASIPDVPRRSPQVHSSSRNSPRPTSPRNKRSVGTDFKHANKRVKHRHEHAPKEFNGDKGVAQDKSINRKISIDLPINSSQRSSRSVSSQQESKNMQTNVTPHKKRGRPFGSKNKQPSFAAMKQQAQAIITEAAAATQPQSPEPVLHSYKCKWVKCTADLHNIDTLKRHVWKKHAPSEEEIREASYTCWWKRCQYLEVDDDGKIVPVHGFDKHEQWVQHIEEDHIQPIAAKYGDGPKASHTGKHMNLSQFRYEPKVGPVARTSSHTDPQSIEQSRTRYLTDEFDRLTTPPVSSDGNPDKPSDAMILTEVHSGTKDDKAKADSAAQNAFMKARGNKAGDTRKVAEEVVRAMEVRKQKIGPGIERGGCTLVNEGQRSTFVQSPGIARVVDADY